jgi:L-threonylcarbamoyladenylate synthase
LPKTRLIAVNAERPEPEPLDLAASILRFGGMVAFATETVYGLGALATDDSAVTRIFAAKGRPSLNPLIVHVHDATTARRYTTAWTEAAETLASCFWPGPLTLVLPRSPEIPQVVTGGRDTVGLRVPAPALARALIERAGRPLAAPSANRSNRVSPTRAEHVLAELDGRIDLILDSGPTQLGLESTVLDLTHSPLCILRPGPVGLDEIEACLRGLDRVVFAGDDDRPSHSPASPGLLSVHYAPRTPAWRVESIEGLASQDWSRPAAVVSFGSHVAFELPLGASLVELADPALAAKSLYAVLHECDSSGVERIVVVMPPDLPEWRVIRDRLIRATRPAPV